MSAEACAQEAASIGAWLQAADTAPATLRVADDLKLAVRNDLPPRRDDIGPSMAPIVWLRPGAILAEQHKAIDGPAALGELLGAHHAQRVRAIADGAFPDEPAAAPTRVYFLIDEATPWPEVVAAVDAARIAGKTAPAFGFRAVSTVPRPPRAPIDTKLDGIRTGAALADLMESEIAGCAPLATLFDEMASPANREPSGAFFARGVGRALTACGCSVDLPDLRSLFYAVFVDPDPIRVIELAPDAPLARVAAPATATWKDVAPRLAARTEGATFVVE